MGGLSALGFVERYGRVVLTFLVEAGGFSPCPHAQMQ